MAAILELLQKEENALREAGQREYAHEDSNAFANFDRVGEQVKCLCEHCGQPTRIGRYAALLVFVAKHFDGVVAWASGHRSQREDVRGRINDIRVYMALLRGMVAEDQGVTTEELLALRRVYEMLVEDEPPSC